jgi:hypothetical protein
VHKDGGQKAEKQREDIEENRLDIAGYDYKGTSTGPETSENKQRRIMLGGRRDTSHVHSHLLSDLPTKSSAANEGQSSTEDQINPRLQIDDIKLPRRISTAYHSNKAADTSLSRDKTLIPVERPRKGQEQRQAPRTEQQKEQEQEQRQGQEEDHQQVPRKEQRRGPEQELRQGPDQRQQQNLDEGQEDQAEVQRPMTDLAPELVTDTKHRSHDLNISETAR